jgi:hypothetical protein
VKRIGRPLPASPQQWLREIAHAFTDAREALPFAQALGHSVDESQLFLIASDVAIKFRGLAPSGSLRSRATDAALASFAANHASHAADLGNPYIAFAFCYMAGHYGLDLLSALEADEVMDYLERNRIRLASAIEGPDRTS